MDFTSDGAIYSSFLTPITSESYLTPVSTVLVQKNQINFYNNPLIDFSNFSGIKEISDFVGAHLYYYTTTLMPASFATNF
jgi:hypothetical protein